jgi:hypothetical protein
MKTSGQKARIRAPLNAVSRKRDEIGEEITRHDEPALIGLRNVYVLGIGQIDGTELPEFQGRATGDAGSVANGLSSLSLHGKS